MGGKSRLAKSIRDVILSRVPDRNVTYWEPFVGGCGSFEVIAPEFARAVGSDLHEDLILMWRAVQNGWEPPTEVSEGEYQELRNAEPSALRGFVGFGGSFGGKWFGGYARGGKTSKGEPRNYVSESARNVLKTRRILTGCDVTFVNLDYRDLEPRPGDVVYCDPPYAGTTEYRGRGFDSAAFWQWCDELHERGVKVFVSEYTAPDHWVEVYRKTLATAGGLRTSDNRDNVDRLFTRLERE